MATTPHPFQFVTASYLTQVENVYANSLRALADGLQHASDGAIFHHTFQTLGQHHFLTEGFSNDFAQWVLAALNQTMLAERLASLDVRDYTSIAELRADLARIVNEFCEERPTDADRTAFEPFYFLRTEQVTLPLPFDARTLSGFRGSLERLSRASFYYHFIASRLRLHLETNDFSVWFARELGLKELAARANRIDMYTNTLDSARRELINMVDREIQS